MPALSSPPRGPALISSPASLVLAVILLLGLGTILSRLRRHFSFTSSSHPSPLRDQAFASAPFLSSAMEKAPLLPPPSQGPSSTNPPLRLAAPYPSIKTSIVPLSHPSSASPDAVIVDLDVPRRRSYTKMTPAGTEVSGEIFVAEGWRRHTKVFGGGVCAACEENEARLAKANVSSAGSGSGSGTPAAGLA